MKYPKFIRATLLAVTFLFSLNTQAVYLSSQDNYTYNTYLSAGSYTGTFDINALMASTFGGDDYIINSGRIIFSFYDDANDVYYSNTVRTSYSGGGTYGSTSYYNINYTNPYEAVTASTGGQRETAISTYYANRTYSHTSSSSRKISQGYNRDVSCGWWDLFRSCTQWVDTSYYVWDDSHYYDNETGYAMNSNVSLYLDTLALDDLMMDGILDYSLDVTGDLMFRNAYLSFDATRVEKPLGIPTEVPEPGSLALLGIGLLGLIGLRRRKA